MNITISCEKKFFAFKYYDPTFCRFKMLILFFDLSVVPLDYSLSTEYKRINISLYAKSYLNRLIYAPFYQLKDVPHMWCEC